MNAPGSQQNTTGWASRTGEKRKHQLRRADELLTSEVVQTEIVNIAMVHDPLAVLARGMRTTIAVGTAHVLRVEANVAAARTIAEKAAGMSAEAVDAGMVSRGGKTGAETIVDERRPMSFTRMYSNAARHSWLHLFPNATDAVGIGGVGGA